VSTEELQDQVTALSEQRDQLQRDLDTKTQFADTLDQQLSDLRKQLSGKLPADLAQNLTTFFDGPARTMNSSDKAAAVIALLSE
jgi:flagellar hook-associated protein FlgK